MSKFYSIVLSLCLAISGQSFAGEDHSGAESDSYLISTVSALIVGAGLLFACKSCLKKNTEGQISEDGKGENSPLLNAQINRLSKFDHEYFKNYPYELTENETVIENLYDRTFTLLISIYLCVRTLDMDESVWFPEEFLFDCNSGKLGRWECPNKFNGNRGYFIDEDDTPVDYLKEDALAYYAYNILYETQIVKKVGRIKEELLIKKSKSIYAHNKEKTISAFADAVASGKINSKSTRDVIHEFLATSQRDGIIEMQEYVEYLAQSCPPFLYCSHPRMLFSEKQKLNNSMHPRDVPGRSR